MRIWKLILLTVVAAALGAPATASASFVHVVSPGESLSSVAAADGVSVSALAAANGLSTDAGLTAGTDLNIPPQGAVPTASTSIPATGGDATGAGGDATGAGGGYFVRPGDSLSEIAAQHGIGVDALAAANGLSVAGVLPAGITLSLDGGGLDAPAQPTGVANTSGSGASPTPVTVSPAAVGSIAAQNGVSPSLAEAIADQESGFSNALVSPTGAAGVMQIEPGTWRYIERNLGGPPLSPDSVTDNVRGGVELLRTLLDQTGGDPALTAAGYYQGLASVRRHGMYADTQRYVNDVLALRDRFGG
ncbi:MAG: LysM peptidoglycan-binding domain-containing protein [Solirubrobacterales bacterium]|nr:LysM peptidoglycan-binding domain-containing protein [Solirubrobacterales bacterium]